jgi:hypothetical protein
MAKKKPAPKKKPAAKAAAARPLAAFRLLEWKPGSFSLYLNGPGYAWERVASRVAREVGLAGKVKFDPEAGMFSAQGERVDLEALQRALEPYLSDREKFREVEKAARAEGND